MLHCFPLAVGVAKTEFKNLVIVEEFIEQMVFTFCLCALPETNGYYVTMRLSANF
jgi:hypothetical protein